jgi:acyl-CoA thioester hydrolase
MHKEFKYNTKVYYEDTDAAGIVYYANYLKFLERARSEAIYSMGLTNKKLLNNYGTIIIVKSCKIDYKSPAKFEDLLEIISKIKTIGKSSFTMDQMIKRKEEVISESEIVLVTVNAEGKPIGIPDVLNKFLN